jgi:hypothetical protein
MSSSGDSHGSGGGHGEHDVHVYEGPGIEEGNAPVPKWYLLVLAVLGVFLVVYLVKYLDGSQPSAAEWKHSR